MCCLEEVYCNCYMFSVVNMYHDSLKLCVLIDEVISFVVNVMLSPMSVMSPAPGLCNLSVHTVMRLCTSGVFAFGVSLVS